MVAGGWGRVVVFLFHLGFFVFFVCFVLGFLFVYFVLLVVLGGHVCLVGILGFVWFCFVFFPEPLCFLPEKLWCVFSRLL